MKSISILLSFLFVFVESAESQNSSHPCSNGTKVPAAPYVAGTCMSLSSTSSGLPGEAPIEAQASSSVTMSYHECYNTCSENQTIYSALQGNRCLCFDTYVGSSVSQSQCNTPCPGNSSQVCGGSGVYSFHLNYLWVSPVEATECAGLPDPSSSNMSTSSTVCFDYQNRINPCKSSCPDGMRLASHDPICDPILRKWVVRQRCYTVKCLSVPHIQHAEVQSLCNEGRENEGCDIKCDEGYELVDNTLKCQAVDEVTPVGAWVGEAICAPVSCGVPPDVDHTLHGYVARHYLESALYTCLSGYSQNGLRTGQREFSVPCRADGSFDVSVVTCKPMTCDLADAPNAQIIASSSGDLPTSPVSLGPHEWVKYQCNEGHTVSGTAGTPEVFTVKCEDGLHIMSQCRPVECGEAPESAYATAEHVSGHVFTYEQKVTFRCLTGYHVGVNRSEKTFQRTCRKDGTFDNALECNRSTCENPPVVENTTSMSGTVDYGAKVVYHCISGHSVGGMVSGSKTFEISCGDLGFTEPKTCTPVKCSSASLWLEEDGKPRASWTADSEARLSVVRHLEPLEFRCHDGYSLDGTADPLQFIGSGTCDPLGVFPIMGHCKEIDDCVVGAHTCGPHGTCRDEHMNYSCQCESGFEEQVVDEERICGNIDDCGDCGPNGVCVDLVGGYTCDCHEGYNATVEENDTVCDKIDCGNYSVSNGTVTPLKLVFNVEAVVTCFPGYTLTGGVKCGSDGEFVAVPSFPVCSPRSCGVPPPLEGSTHPEEEVFFQGSVEYTCKTGHTVGGFSSSSTVFSRTCLYDGTFSEVDLLCLPRSCGVPPRSYSASRPDVALVFGQVVTYTCLPGFARNPKDVSTTTSEMSCTENGFVPLAPQICMPLVCDRQEFDNVNYTRVSVGCNESDDSTFNWLVLGSRVTYFCLTGFTFTGQSSGAMSISAECGASGALELEGVALPTSICQRVNCGTPPIVLHSSQRLIGQNVEYTCDAGYATSDGNTTFVIECQHCGHFSPVHQCRNVDDCPEHNCGPQGTCVDGVNDYTCDCLPGYEETEVGGEKVCGNPPGCDGVGCGGYGSCLDLVEGYKCQCNPGYEQIQEGNAKICKAKSCGNVSVANSRTPMPVSLYYPQKKTIMCEEGYSTDASRQIAAGKFEVECSPTGILNVQSCQPILCDAFPALTCINPILDIGNNVFGRNLTYYCLDGYSIDGTRGGPTFFKGSCSSDGSWAVPDCKPITCGSFPAPRNGIASPVAAVYQGLVHVSCNIGYSLSKSSYIPEARYSCTVGGTYNMSTSPTCYRRTCGVPPVVPHATCNRTTVVNFGDSVIYKCDEGYTDGGVPDGNTIFEVPCLGLGSFVIVSRCSPVAVAVNAKVLAYNTEASEVTSITGAIIKWQSGGRSGVVTTTPGYTTLHGLPPGKVDLTPEYADYDPVETVSIYASQVKEIVPLLMTPKVTSKGWRVVLSWGRQTRDLDLWAYLGYGSRTRKYRISYKNKKKRGVMWLDGHRSMRGPDTLRIPNWSSCRVCRNACVLTLRVVAPRKCRCYRRAVLTDAKVDIYNGDTLMQSFKVEKGRTKDPHNGQLVTVGRNWWVGVLQADGKIMSCRPLQGCRKTYPTNR